MFKKTVLRRTVPLMAAALTTLTPSLGQAASTVSITPDPAVAQYKVPTASEPTLTAQQQITLLRQKVKYVFVIYQENRSFDSYFGTFPGAAGLFTQPVAKTPGFYQKIVNTDGSTGLIHPFRISPSDAGGNMYPQDTDDIDHSHPRTVAKMDFVNSVPRMDQFAVTEEKKYSPAGPPSLKAKQFGELAMAYEDGDTVPFLWRYANRFVLFDHIFEEMSGPSTPGNLSIFGAQSGQTQAMLHPNEVYTDNGGGLPGVPVMNDYDPYWGSKLDLTSGLKGIADPSAAVPQLNLTYATLALTLAGSTLGTVAQSDTSAADLADVTDDVPFITKFGAAGIPWGWYEEGFDKEPTDVPTSADPVDANGTHASYITHHNGPQYFGYVANNPQMTKNLRGLQDFYSDLDNQKLPASGIFYVKGGFQNLLGLKPADPNATTQTHFLGDDDHPAYSDAQISEAAVATAVNKIAASPYWGQCAIVITWDDSEGDYDHIQPELKSVGPDGSVISDGPRVPLLLISPYAKTNTVTHDVGDQGSVVKFADALFNLTPLADLPDELKGRQIGTANGLANQGPDDDLTPDVSDLTAAFDPARLSGTALPLPSSYATIDPSLITQIPATVGLPYVGVLPTDYQRGLVNQIPADFNPRPNTLPGALTAP